MFSLSFSYEWGTDPKNIPDDYWRYSIGGEDDEPITYIEKDFCETRKYNTIKDYENLINSMGDLVDNPSDYLDKKEMYLLKKSENFVYSYIDKYCRIDFDDATEKPNIRRK